MSDRGYYFVRYSDGGITFLMSKSSAHSYASIFKGTVHRHSEAPRLMRNIPTGIYNLISGLACAGFVVAIIKALGGL